MEEFRKTCRKMYLIPRNSVTRNPVIKYYIRRKKIGLFSELAKNGYDLVYNSTVTTGEVLQQLSFLNVPVITDANELDYWIDKVGLENASLIRQFTSHYVAASRSVAECLLRRGLARPDNVKTNYVMVDFGKLDGQEFKESLRAKMGIPPESLIIGACGAEVFRKGKDLFLHVANDLLSRALDKEIHFVWIGGEMTDEIRFDFERSPYREYIHFIDHSPVASGFFREFDVFVMLSRDDPFPIVNVEVGFWGVPIVCFEGTGGSVELIADGGGIAVPYGQLRLFADAVLSLIDHPEKRSTLGKVLREKVISSFGVDAVSEKLMGIISAVSQKQKN
jgi:glycosyltransferase involved in cell wall biosynthesis